jgi:transcriptional regulator GlxA family with amidase domain
MPTTLLALRIKTTEHQFVPETMEVTVAVQKVAIVIHEGVQALDVAGPMDVSTEANSFVPDEDRYDVVLVAANLDPIRAANNMRMLANVSFEQADGGFDILLVAGGPNLPGAKPDPRLVEWLRLAPHRAAIYGSVCTGAFPLGHAGMLDGHRVTTHWQNAPKLAAEFPAARVEHDAIYIRDEQLVTSAGITAGIDLALAFVNQQHGQQVSVAVAKRLVVVAQPQGGQSQFRPYLVAPAEAESPIRRVQDHVMVDIGRHHTLGSLAHVAGMSARSLARHFVQETGITPHEFIDRARVDAARKLLEGTDRPLKAVAYDCGFATADRMRLVFNNRLGTTPAQHRASFHRSALAWPWRERRLRSSFSPSSVLYLPLG